MNTDNEFADSLEQDLAEGRVLEWAELYALDALSEDERAAIDAYLDDAGTALHAAFRNRVRQGRETLAQAYGNQDAEPPPGLLAQILRRLPAQDSPSAHNDPGRTAAGSTAPVADLAGRRAAKRHRSPTSARRLIMAAAAAALIVFGGAAIAQNLLTPSVQDQIQQASDRTHDSVSVPGGGTVDIALSHDVNAAVVTFKNMPAPKPGKVYQLWRIPAGGASPVSAGTMSAQELAKPKSTLLQGIDSFTALALTVEPDGGSPQPTTTPFVELPLGS